jgi:pyrroline-5-carboxylate reductase
MKIAFLGGGNITTALLGGFGAAGDRATFIVHDRNPPKLRRLRRDFNIFPERDLRCAVTEARMLIIAVRPASVLPLLAGIGRLKGSKIAVSLAAGIPLRDLRPTLGPQVHWARAMPSPVCRAGRGLAALAFDRAMTPRERNVVRAFFGRLGTAIVIPEREFDVFSAAFSPSQGYYALAALSSAAQELGLNRKVAYVAAAHALSDSIAEWRDSRAPLQQLIAEAATPGGIAATVMATKDSAGYKDIMRRSLRAGIERARQLRART